jgi:hypothetical protein
MRWAGATRGILFLTFPRLLAALSRDFDAWWKRSIAALPGLDHAQVKALFAKAVRRHDEAMVMQANGIFSTLQPLYDAVAQRAFLRPTTSPAPPLADSGLSWCSSGRARRCRSRGPTRRPALPATRSPEERFSAASGSAAAASRGGPRHH